MAEKSVDLVVFAYSDVTHEHVMHTASRALAGGRRLRAARAGADDDARAPSPSWRPAPREPAPARARPRATSPRCSRSIGLQGRGRPPPHAVRRSRRPAGPALRQLRRSRPLRHHDRGARRVRAAPRRRAASCTPASTTRRSCARPRRRPTSSCGTAATTTSRSTSRTCSSSSPIRFAPATSSTTTRARRTSAWPTWS